ncbi:MAG: hypothetical protein AAGI11_06375 [Pseudomonadota bacterium]
MATNPQRLPEAVEAVVNTDGLEHDGKRIDLRTRQGRVWRDHIRRLAAQLGGAPTASQGILLRRAATLCLLLESDEAKLLAGKSIKSSEYRANADKLRAILLQLGLASKSRDITKADQELPDDHAALILGD